MEKVSFIEMNSTCLSDVEISQVKGGQMFNGNCVSSCKFVQIGGSSIGGNGNTSNQSGLNSARMDSEKSFSSFGPLGPWLRQ